jgi:hypothetical protein
MVDETGWAPNMRGKRRLGVAEDGGSARWVGFAGLARTVVEALVDEGGRRDEDIESSKAMVANRLADMRHVLGGECENAVSTEQGVADLREHLSNAEKAVVRHGGATSELRERLATARGKAIPLVRCGDTCIATRHRVGGATQCARVRCTGARVDLRHWRRRRRKRSPATTRKSSD